MSNNSQEKSMILDLLTDPADAADMLEALDYPVYSAASATTTLREALADSQLPRAFAALVTFAGKFARMADSIASFLKRYGVAPNAQLHIPETGIVLNLDSFRAPWATKPDTVWSDRSLEQSVAVANSIMSLTEQLRFENFIYVDRDQVDRRIALQAAEKERQTPAPRQPTSRDTLLEYCADGDYSAIKFASMAVGEVLHDLSRSRLSLNLQAAFEEVAASCSSLLRRMETATIIQGIDPSTNVATLADEVYLYASQARMLAAEFADADRAQEGFGDFLRSHFWRQRWRLYEIWLLTKIIDSLGRVGGEVSLHATANGVWNLPYGQSVTPIASARFLGQVVDVYYQYIEHTTTTAHMPDIFVRDTTKGALLVLDPKHGLSYTRSKVQEVLKRYHTHFQAALTAIVNYFSVRSYRYDLASAPRCSWLLASGVAPGTVEEQRLEHTLADAWCGRGYFQDLVRQSPLPRSRKWTTRAAGLLYWAGGAREVDEPVGAWCYTREQGARPLAALKELIDQPVRGVEGTPDGGVCALRADVELTLISLLYDRVIWKTRFEERIDSLTWNSASTQLLVKVGDEICNFDAKGEHLFSVQAPTKHWEPLIAWIGSAPCILYAHQTSLSHVVAYRCDLGQDWEKILDFEVERFASIELRALGTATPDAIILQVSPLHAFLVTARDIGEADVATSADISTSPSGRYTVRRGPISLRASDGISLLEVSDRDNPGRPLPLVRFIGDLIGGVKWNSDESTIAFLTQRRFRGAIDDIRVATVIVGDKDATTASLPNQAPQGFAWVSQQLLREIESQ